MVHEVAEAGDARTTVPDVAPFNVTLPATPDEPRVNAPLLIVAFPLPLTAVPLAA